MKNARKTEPDPVAQETATQPDPLNAIFPEDYQAMVAEAAYFLAEQRGFAPGYEVEDWLEAEALIKQHLYNS